MQPDQSNDTWGGFQMGPEGLIPIDEEVYHSRLPHSYNQVLEYAAIIAADMWPPPGIDLPYVPEPQDINLPHVPDPGDEAYLELLDLDALSVESVVSAASAVIIEPQNPSPTIINISSDDENEYPEPVIPHVEVIDISSDDE
ncbi:unnamed protein product [Prunus armeniaca]|uniref:Uncharacterized protein n=1 Tax=Prunus armeniaca TaxID=36596 RepID=A0A6J5TIV3_PRUAR|nr:unnamed protein product [Prunus armeniaca]